MCLGYHVNLTPNDVVVIVALIVVFVYGMKRGPNQFQEFGNVI